MGNDSYVCLYVDNSNVFHEGQRFATTVKGEPRADFRLYFKNFMKLVVAGRKVAEVVWAGSIPPGNDDLWTYLEGLGIKPDLIPRADSGENETVDHKIQLRMHRHARKYKASPGTMILATGDGKGYFKEEGFLYDVEGFVQDGWNIEVVSWDHSCHGELKKFAVKHGKYIKLDDYYEKISFVKGGRIVSKV